MTGLYVRVERAGKWLNLEIEELTEAELRTFLRLKEPEWVLGCAVILAKTLRGAGGEMQELRGRLELAQGQLDEAGDDLDRWARSFKDVSELIGDGLK